MNKSSPVCIDIVAITAKLNWKTNLTALCSKLVMEFSSAGYPSVWATGNDSLGEYKIYFE